MTIPNPVTGRALWKYFADYAGVSKMSSDGFYTLAKDLPCFKMAWCTTGRAIVNLVIPAGTQVYAGNFAFHAHNTTDHRKMRAAKARVVSIFSYERGTEQKSAYSDYDASFNYKPGKVVKPDNGFCGFQNQCAAGIHFFLNVHDAVNYD